MKSPLLEFIIQINPSIIELKNYPKKMYTSTMIKRMLYMIFLIFFSKIYSTESIIKLSTMSTPENLTI